MRDHLLTPIPGDNPAGTDLRYELYDIVREARREEIDTPTGGWDRPRKVADWTRVAKETSQALATRSKDLQLAVWLIEATYHRESFAGFAAAVRMTAQLLETFWDHLYPQLEDGDPEARIAPLAWLGSDMHPLCQAVRLAPVTTSGLTIVEFRNAEDVGVELPPDDYDATQARKKKIHSGKMSPEEFEQAFNATPKAWYQQRSADLVAALDALDMLDRVGTAKFGPDAPEYSELRKPIEEVQAVIRKLLGRKLAREPDPVEDAAEQMEGGPASARIPSDATPEGLTSDVKARWGSLGGSELRDGPVQTVHVEPPTFTVFFAPELDEEVWQGLLVYLHSPAGAAAVDADARHRWEGSADRPWSATAPAAGPVAPGTEITVVPELPGCLFNPARATIAWLEDWHRIEFRLVARASLPGFVRGGAASGRVTFYAGPLILGEVTIWAHFRARASEPPQPRAPVASNATAYHAVFASYSHRDAEVVDGLERAISTLGFTYLRDVKILRSGEAWSPTLLRKIEEADLFQLYWSEAARASREVEREWRHALFLRRQGFVRPVYWQQPLAEPPAELRSLHFAYLKLD